MTNYDEITRLVRKGRRAELRGKALQGCITGQVTSILNALFGGWMLMLTAGIVHAEWITSLPTVGYWWAVAIVALMRGVFSRIPKTESEK
jgi:hypothetical protein